MLHVSISLRALVFVVLLLATLCTGTDVARGAPSAAELQGDGLLMTNPGQNGARDIHTDSGGGGNLGGVRIYAGNTLTNPPTTAALQFFGNGHTVFPGQAFIDSGSNNNAAIIFRTASIGGLAERMRISAGGSVTIGSPAAACSTVGSLCVQAFIHSDLTITADADIRASHRSIAGDPTHTCNDDGDVCAASDIQADDDLVAGSGCVKNFSGTQLAGSCPSDGRLKRDVVPLDTTLAQLTALQPVTFNWRVEEFPDMELGDERSYGLIAQDVEAILPELVSDGANGYKVVHYERLPMLLLQGLKDVTAEKDALQVRVGVLVEHNATLEARLAAIEQRLNGGTAPLVAAR